MNCINVNIPVVICTIVCKMLPLGETGWRVHISLYYFLRLHVKLCYAMLCYAKSLQSCPTLCDPIDGSPAGSPVPGILQARTLEWVAISFSSAWKWKVKVKSLNRVQLLATPWIAAYQAPPSMGFFRQKYWSGVPLPSPCKAIMILIKSVIKIKICGRKHNPRNTRKFWCLAC